MQRLAFDAWIKTLIWWYQQVQTLRKTMQKDVPIEVRGKNWVKLFCDQLFLSMAIKNGEAADEVIRPHVIYLAFFLCAVYVSSCMKCFEQNAVAIELNTAIATAFCCGALKTMSTSRGSEYEPSADQLKAATKFMAAPLVPELKQLVEATAKKNIPGPWASFFAAIDDKHTAATHERLEQLKVLGGLDRAAGPDRSSAMDLGDDVASNREEGAEAEEKQEEEQAGGGEGGGEDEGEEAQGSPMEDEGEEGFCYFYIFTSLVFHLCYFK